MAKDKVTYGDQVWKLAELFLTQEDRVLGNLTSAKEVHELATDIQSAIDAFLDARGEENGDASVRGNRETGPNR